MSAERAASDNTIAAYQRDLDGWAAALKSMKRDFETAGTGSLEAVLAGWAEQGLAPSTAARKLSCLLYTSPSPRDGLLSRMPSSA